MIPLEVMPEADVYKPADDDGSMDEDISEDIDSGEETSPDKYSSFDDTRYSSFDAASPEKTRSRKQSIATPTCQILGQAERDIARPSPPRSSSEVEIQTSASENDQSCVELDMDESAEQMSLEFDDVSIQDSNTSVDIKDSDQSVNVTDKSTTDAASDTESPMPKESVLTRSGSALRIVLSPPGTTRDLSRLAELGDDNDGASDDEQVSVSDELLAAVCGDDLFGMLREEAEDVQDDTLATPEVEASPADTSVASDVSFDVSYEDASFASFEEEPVDEEDPEGAVASPRPTADDEPTRNEERVAVEEEPVDDEESTGAGIPTPQAADDSKQDDEQQPDADNIEESAFAGFVDSHTKVILETLQNELMEDLELICDLRRAKYYEDLRNAAQEHEGLAAQAPIVSSVPHIRLPDYSALEFEGTSKYAREYVGKLIQAHIYANGPIQWEQLKAEPNKPANTISRELRGYTLTGGKRSRSQFAYDCLIFDTVLETIQELLPFKGIKKPEPWLAPRRGALSSYFWKPPTTDAIINRAVKKMKEFECLPEEQIVTRLPNDTELYPVDDVRKLVKREIKRTEPYWNEDFAAREADIQFAIADSIVDDLVSQLAQEILHHDNVEQNPPTSEQEDPGGENIWDFMNDDEDM